MRPSRSRPATVVAVAMLAALAAAPAHPSGIGKLAYTSFQGSGYPSIWLATPDGANPTRVSPPGSDGDGAAISPEGARIVFESPRRYYAQLYVINTDGTGEHRIMSVDFYGQSGTWSPDGQRIAFTHSSNNGLPGGVGSTWVVNADGTGLAQLSPAGVDDWNPHWSPDGTRIVFCSTVGGHTEIFVTDADGSDRAQLTSGTAHRVGPRWSPDGTRIAYALFPTPGIWTSGSIHVMDADGSNDVAVTDSAVTNMGAAWSPDGDRIAFHSNRSGCFQVYTIAPDGTDLRRVTWVASTPGDFVGSWAIVTLPAGVADGAGAALALSVTSPARGSATVRFTLAREGVATLQVFDSTGRLVRTVLRQRLGAGAHTAAWDGRDARGRACPRGVYQCRIASGAANRTARLVVLR